MKLLRTGLFAVLLLAPLSDVYPQDKVRVGLSSVSALHGALWVAQEKGILRKHGIDAEVIVVGGAGTTGVSALLANDIQYVSSAGDAIINSNLRGGDTVMIASVINSSTAANSNLRCGAMNALRPRHTATPPSTKLKMCPLR